MFLARYHIQQYHQRSPDPMLVIQPPQMPNQRPCRCQCPQDENDPHHRHLHRMGLHRLHRMGLHRSRRLHRMSLHRPHRMSLHHQQQVRLQ